MKLIIRFALLAMVLSGCKPQPVAEEKPVAPEEPAVAKVSVADLTVAPDHRKLNLTWRKVGQGMIAGYNIYISDRPLAALFPGNNIDSKITPYNSMPFPGDTIPEDGIEHFEADNLENGVLYHVSVRVVFPDHSLSAPSNEVTAACGGRGTAELAMRHTNGNDGFSFDQNQYVVCDDKHNDFYYYNKDGRDFLASPHRLDAFINKTGLLILPWKGSMEDIAARLPEAKTLTGADQIEVAAGNWVLLRCARGTQALVQVRDFDGSGEKRRISFAYAYSSLTGETFF